MSPLEVACGVILSVVVFSLVMRALQVWRRTKLMKPEGTPIRSANMGYRGPGPPPGFIKVDSTVQAGHIVRHHGEECFAVEVVHRIDQENYLTWAKLEPLPGPKSALDRLLGDDEVL